MTTLSILIPTLVERRARFERLSGKLRRQIVDHALAGTVEIVHCLDDRERSVGAKRNWLMDQAAGEFIAFVDDDDDVSDEYLPLLCRTLREHPAIDCIGITGVIVFAGGERRPFVHSLQHRRYVTRDGVYCRPPYHLNPIRRAIARRYRFEEISYSEDIDWALRLCRDRALRREQFIPRPIYTYHCRRSWRYQRLLDLSEPVRHALGVQLVNRIRLRRWLRTRLGRAT